MANDTPGNSNSEAAARATGSTASANTPGMSPLGKQVTYGGQYKPGLLFAIPRAEKRSELGLSGTLPFFGLDIWNAYEVSWLNGRGKPQVAIVSLQVPADSPNIVESKSLKLYLNSLNETRLSSPDALIDLVRQDLADAFGAAITLSLVPPEDFGKLRFQELDGLLLDRLDIEVESYAPDPTLLKASTDQAPVEETLVSHLLKSNCLITGQPDWASVQIKYVGPQIDQESLLRYLIGFRQHNEFHEQCVERIFVDILRACRPQKLSVYARYTRRGGLDINPWRTNFTTGKKPANERSARQ